MNSRIKSVAGPKGVFANTWRHNCDPLIKRNVVTNNHLKNEQIRCCGCGFSIPEELKLPVFNEKEQKEQKEEFDYVRIPLYDKLSSFVFCTPACGLQYYYKIKTITQTHGVDDFHALMWKRHHLDEPVNAAPSAEALAYVVPNGLSHTSFYILLSQISLIGYCEKPPKYIPPHEDEHLALTDGDSRFTQYYFQDLLPSHIKIKLPAMIDESGIHLDANPDSDTETDFSTDQIHPEAKK
jgi:hypothetical protein